MVSKVFELYRRAAMGDGNLGTPVPRPAIQILSVTAADSMHGEVIITITAKTQVWLTVSFCDRTWYISSRR